MSNKHRPQFPDGPYVAVKWRDICEEGESLTKNQIAHPAIARRAVLAGWDFEALNHFAKLTRNN